MGSPEAAKRFLRKQLHVNQIVIFIEIDGKTISQDHAAQAIQALFDQAKAHKDATGQGAVILITDIDDISNIYRENASARHRLLRLLDLHKYDIDVFVVVTTNHYKYVSDQLRRIVLCYAI